MKKIVLSTLVALSIASGASAADTQFYSDANGQVFTTPADGRTAVPMKKEVSWTSNASSLDFSMLAYIGFVNNDYRDNSATGANKPDNADFEARRMYFQVKAYLLEDPKSYFRVTYDVYNPSQVSYTSTSTTTPSVGTATTTTTTSTTSNYYAAMVKYAYLYLDKILPFTDIEIGQSHTTLLDYEESHSWAYRSIDNVFTEQDNGPKLNASAARGADLKTNTKYFSSEIGVYNNNGYHDPETTYNNNGMGMDYEGRFTAHVLGTGTDYNMKHTYFDASLLAKHNVNVKNVANNGGDMTYYGLHSVFNMENLLVAAQYISSEDTSKTTGTISSYAGNGWSANFDARLGEKDQYHVFGRYDIWTQKEATGTSEYAQRTYIGGVAWDMNKNIQWVANVITTDNEKNIANSNSSYTGKNGNSYMLTAQVSF